ncbi:MAG TPA: LysM peptidoglycan-binding domain-containing protein [Gammaproteobacteria bacterium]
MRERYRLVACLGASLLLGACALQPPQDESADIPEPVTEAPATAEADEGPLPPKQDDTLPKLVQVEERASPPSQDSAESAAPAAPAAPKAAATGHDLWGRIASGFALPDHEHPRALRERTWLVNRPAYLVRVAERARPYLHLIAEAVESRGVPGEIALLPIVESAFQPFAYSHGRAAGLWQFIPGTGRLYGLKQNWWYDGRRDVYAATEAALNYLQRLHDFFDGDWLLALAAYNAGEGTVQRAVERNRRAGKPTDFWSLKLPRETTAYVPKLLAVSDVFTAPAAFGLTLPSIADRQVLAAVDTQSQIDLARAAELAELSIEELYQYNPGFNRWATDPDGPHRLLVPVATAELFAERIAALDDSERLLWQRHRIASGESLISIAMQYRTTPDVLRRVNRLDGDLIRAGHHLLIPVAGASEENYVLSAEQRLAALASESLSPDRTKVVHVVRAGDSLWRIGRRYGVSVRQLAAWNGSAPGDTLRLGQQLSVWLPPRASATALAALTPGTAAVTPRLQSIRYTVREGDSLWRVSRRFNVSVENLRQWNDLKHGDYLQPGQQLTLHVDVTRQSSSG